MMDPEEDEIKVLDQNVSSLTDTSRDGEIDTLLPSSKYPSIQLSDLNMDQSDDTQISEDSPPNIVMSKKRKLMKTPLYKAMIDKPGPSLARKVKKRRQWPEMLALKIVVAILFLIIVFGVLVTWALYKEERQAIQLGLKFRLMESSRMLYLAGPKNADDDDSVLTGHLGLSLPKLQLQKSCGNTWEEPEKLCARWKFQATLRIGYYRKDQMHCYNISWESEHENFQPIDCYETGNAVWYGLSGNIRGSHWLISEQNYSFIPIVSGGGHKLGSVVEGYWLSSKGVGVQVEKGDPVLVSWNNKDHRFCLKSAAEHTFYANMGRKWSNLNYKICHSDNTRITHEGMRQFLPMPDFMSTLIPNPIWAFINTSQSSNLKDANSSGIMESFLSFLDEKGLHCDVIDLDIDFMQWAFEYENNASLTHNLLNLLRNSNCSAILPVNLFNKFSSENCNSVINREYLVKDAGGECTGLTRWDDKELAVLDISNPSAVSWLHDILHDIKTKYNIGMFRYKQGEGGYLPYKAKFYSKNISSMNFTTVYNDLHRLNISISDSAQDSQGHLIIISIAGVKNYTYSNVCLSDIVPSILSVGILGYPYIVLDGTDLFKAEFSEELYIRWMQMSAFMPVMKAIIPPYFNSSLMPHIHKVIKFHADIIMPIIKSILSDIPKGLAILRPVWWVDPYDTIAQRIGDEFLVGNEILVAPILCEGQRERNIYLPKGTWQDPLKHLQLDGGRWLYKYSVTLNDIPYFILRS